MPALVRALALLLPLAGASASFGPAAPHGHAPERYSVDLDLPPSERWRAVFSDFLGRVGVQPFRDYFAAVHEGLRRDYNATYAYCREHLEAWQQAYAQQMPGALQEVYALADALSAHATSDEERRAFRREEVFLVQLHMELGNIGAPRGGECTSVVVRRPDGGVAHFRNWDFGPLPDALGMVSVEVDFHFGRTERRGFRCLLALTHIMKWTTCLKPVTFSMSLNAREYGRGFERGRPPAEELALLQRGHMPRVAVLREVMLASSYDQALATAATARALTSLYVILAAPAPERGSSAQGRAAVVTISGNGSSADVLPLPPAADGWFLVQTNVDHWLPMSDESPSSHRREHVKALLRNRGQHASLEQLYAVLQDQEAFPPGRTGDDEGRVFRPSTIASVLMLPGALAAAQVGNASWRADVWRPGSGAGGRAVEVLV